MPFVKNVESEVFFMVQVVWIDTFIIAENVKNTFLQIHRTEIQQDPLWMKESQEVKSPDKMCIHIKEQTRVLFLRAFSFVPPLYIIILLYN